VHASPSRSLGEPLAIRFMSSFGLQAPSAASEPLPGLQTPRQYPGSCCFRRTLEPMPVPSTGITRLHRYYGPLRLPLRPGVHAPYSVAFTLTGVRLTVTIRHRSGAPAFTRFLLPDMPSSLPRRNRGSLIAQPVHARAWLCSPTAAAFPVDVPGRLPHRRFRGLLDVHSRYGLPVRGIAITILSVEGFDDFLASIAAPTATGWSDPLPGGFRTR